MMDFDGCGACVLACVFPVQTASFRASENQPSTLNPQPSTLNPQPSTRRRSKLPCFQAHKDIVIPPMLAVPALFRDARALGSSQKDIVVYFRGAAFGSEKAGPWAAGYSSGSRQTSECPPSI